MVVRQAPRGSGFVSVSVFREREKRGAKEREYREKVVVGTRRSPCVAD